MSNGEPETAEQLVSLLGKLHAQRDSKKRHEPRRRLSALQRQQVHAKTGGRCHICGGKVVDTEWQVDDVLAHSSGGGTEADNCLAAHMLCNSYRWHYLAEEFRLILKLGVLARTQIEEKTSLGEALASEFIEHEKRRRKRRRDVAAARLGD